MCLFVLFFANSKCPALCSLQMLRFFANMSSFAFAVKVISSVVLIVTLKRGVKRCRLLPQKVCSETRSLFVCFFVCFLQTAKNPTICVQSLAFLFVKSE